MKLSLIAAVSENGVIGSGPDIPWHVKGEQLLFKALTFNQWVLVGRKTFASMGILPNRKYAIVSRSLKMPAQKDIMVYTSIEEALGDLRTFTEQVLVSGGGQIFSRLIHTADTIHLSTVHLKATGDVYFPEIPRQFHKVFSQYFTSNINYTYEIWQRR